MSVRFPGLNFFSQSAPGSSSSSSSTYILLNNSNIAYFWHNVFNKLNQTFILTGCREVLCVYDMTLVLLK